jgi:hypothetical protein
MTVMLLLVKNSLVKKELSDGDCHDATASSFVAKVRGEVFTHFHAVAVKRHSSHFPLGRLLLCVRVKTVNPNLVTSNNSAQDRRRRSDEVPRRR